MMRLDVSGSRYCSATSVSLEKPSDRSFSCYWQGNVVLEAYNPNPIGEYSKGKVYAVSSRNAISTEIKALFPGDIVVIDERNKADDDYITMEIQYSALIQNKKDQLEILTILNDYEKKNPTKWYRTIDSMMIEWEAHNDVYNITNWIPIGEPYERALHVSLNNSEEGWSWTDHTIGRFLSGR